MHRSFEWRQFTAYWGPCMTFTVYENAVFHTLDPQNPTASALVAEEGRIRFLGSVGEAREFAPQARAHRSGRGARDARHGRQPHPHRPARTAPGGGRSLPRLLILGGRRAGCPSRRAARTRRLHQLDLRRTLEPPRLASCRTPRSQGTRCRHRLPPHGVAPFRPAHLLAELRGAGLPRHRRGNPRPGRGNHRARRIRRRHRHPARSRGLQRGPSPGGSHPGRPCEAAALRAAHPGPSGHHLHPRHRRHGRLGRLLRPA